MKLKYSLSEVREQLIKNAEFSEDWMKAVLTTHKVNHKHKLLDIVKNEKLPMFRKQPVEIYLEHEVYAFNCRAKAEHLYSDADYLILSEDEASKLGLLR